MRELLNVTNSWCIYRPPKGYLEQDQAEKYFIPIGRNDNSNMFHFHCVQTSVKYQKNEQDNKGCLVGA